MSDSKTEKAKSEVDAAISKEEDKGFSGEEVDPTPNERYSQESDDWRTPESDPEAASAAGSSKFQHLKEAK